MQRAAGAGDDVEQHGLAVHMDASDAHAAVEQRTTEDIGEIRPTSGTCETARYRVSVFSVKGPRPWQ